MKPLFNIRRWLAASSLTTRPASVALAALTGGIVFSPAAHAADIQWTGTTASYNTPANWAGGVIPGPQDNAIVNNGGTVQILPTDPTWFVFDLRASNGNYVQSGSRARLNAWLRIGVAEGSNGTYTLSGGRLDVTSGLARIGERGTGTLNVSGGQIYQRNGQFVIGDRTEGPNTTGKGTLNQTGGTINSNSQFDVANSGDSASVGDISGIYNMSGGTLNLGGNLVVGRNGGDGEFHLTGGTVNTSQQNGGNFIVGSFEGNAGSTGYFEQNGGNVNTGSELWIGQGNDNATNNTEGIYELRAGTLEINNWLAVGRVQAAGTLNMSGGVLRKYNPNNSFTMTGNSTVNHTGGLMDIVGGTMIIGEYGPTTANYNLGGGTTEAVLTVGETIVVRNNATGITGNLNLLPNGTLRTGRLFKQSTTATSPANVIFNGGKLVATRNQVDFISNLNNAFVDAGGLLLDTNGFTVTSPQVFQGPGDFTKNGLGTLVLSGVSPVDGIAVDHGILENNGSISSFFFDVADTGALGGSGSITGDVNLGVTSGSVLLADSTAATPLNVDGFVTAANTRIEFKNPSPPVGTPIRVLTYTNGLSGNFVLGRPGTIDTSVFGEVSVTLQAPRTVTWTGAANSTWDVFQTTNWTAASTAAKFGQKDTVELGNAAGTAPITIAGAVRPAAINVNNTNTITLTGNADSNIAGPVVVNKTGAGKLIVGIDTTINANQTTPVAIPSSVTIGAGELQLGNGGTTGSLGFAPITNNGLLSFNYSGAKSLPNNIDGVGSLAKSGAGELTLTGTVAYSGTTTINAGRLRFVGAALPGTGAITNNGELEMNNNPGVVNVDAVISGTGKFIKSGYDGEVWLRAANTFSGDVEVVRGVNNALNITHASALGTTAGKTIVRGNNGTGGAFLNIRALTGGGTTIAEPFELISGAFGRAGLRHEGGTQTLTLTGPITVSSTAMSGVQFWNSNPGSTLNIQGDITGSLNGAQFFFRGSTGPINLTGSINIADEGEFTVTGDGRVRLGAPGKTYSGFRTTVAVGQLQTLGSNILPADKPVALGESAASLAKLILGEGATGVTQTISGLSSAAANASSGIVSGTSGQSTLIINQNSNSAYNLPLGGSGTNENNLAIVKSGGGILTLGAANSFHTGPTTISGGTLAVNGNIKSSNFTVEAGGTLAGSGSTGKLTTSGTAANPAVVAPGGNGIGTLSVGDTVFGPGTVIDWQVQNWTSSADRLTTTLRYTITATAANPVVIRISQLNLQNFPNPETNATFSLAQGILPVSGFDPSKFVIDASRFTAGTGTWALRQAGASLFLDYTAGTGTTGSYATWATSNGIPGEPSSGDFDKDGLTNLVEYALGLDPTKANGFPGTVSGGTLSFTKGAAAVANGDVTYRIETSPTLAAGSWTTATPTTNSNTTISYALPTGQGRVFARLVVTKIP